MSDIIERIKRIRYIHVPEASQLFEEAIGEIERLRSLVRFQDGVIRSGDVGCLTDEERAALTRAIETLEGVEYMEAFATENDATAAATLRGLLERLAGRPVTEPMPFVRRD